MTQPHTATRTLLLTSTRARREVEGRSPIMCMLVALAVALLVGVGLYSHYCPCVVLPAHKRAPAATTQLTAN